VVGAQGTYGVNLCCEFGSWKSVISTRELKLKGASQQGHEPLEKKSEGATPLEELPSSAVKTVTENTGLYVIVVCKM
jgi:hypothetical protein